MPSCNGPPDGPCPYNAKGDMVYFNYAELGLCDECEKEHREAFMGLKEASQTSVKSVNTKVHNNGQGPTTKQNESVDCTHSLLMDYGLSYILFSL